MNRNLRMVIFVVVMGIVTSVLLMGVDALTAERIQLNQQAQLQSAILDAYDIDYDAANIGQIFNDHFETKEIDDLVFFIHNDSGAISYEFSGDGLWGPIRAVISFEDDFETIRQIRVLQQEETPGLGGVIASHDYLDTFIGKNLSGGLIISQSADASLDDEVDAITGATGTSNAFEGMLNRNYETFKETWEQEGGSDDA